MRPFPFLLLAGLALSPFAHASGDGDCSAFTWDVSHELKRMGGNAQAIPAYKSVREPGTPLQLDMSYDLQLHPQAEVDFVVAPEKSPADADAKAGIAYFYADADGRYRIALNSAHWIDVIDGGADVLDKAGAKVLASVDHEGQGKCASLRKIVSFDLEAGKTYRLHLSGKPAATVRLLVTREAEKS